MNERIFTELYKKAWGHFPCPTGEPELEKFAELIVRECASIDFRHKVGMTTDQDFYTSRAIMEHFGVEL